MGEIKALFTWRSAICESDLPATTRHVALALSLYMSERGDSAHPGATRLARDTGLSERCVRSQLAKLAETGWLILRERGGEKGDKRRANVYEARIPATPLPLDAGTSCTREPDAPVKATTSTPAPRRAAPLHDVQPISSENSPENSPTRAVDVEFESWWSSYPRKIAKQHALKAYRAAAKLATADQLAVGLAASKQAWERERRSIDKIPHAQTWLNGHRWADEHGPSTNGSSLVGSGPVTATVVELPA